MHGLCRNCFLVLSCKLGLSLLIAQLQFRPRKYVMVTCDKKMKRISCISRVIYICGSFSMYKQRLYITRVVTVLIIGILLWGHQNLGKGRVGEAPINSARFWHLKKLEVFPFEVLIVILEVPIPHA
jgi:hypothetical protein